MGLPRFGGLPMAAASICLRNRGAILCLAEVLQGHAMRELQRALADINAIRTQMARETLFRGYGPRSTAASGLLALMVASGQVLWQRTHESSAEVFLGVWVCTAVAAAVFSVGETILRTRRMHATLWKQKFQIAIEHFLPAIVVGLMLTVVLRQVAPEVMWMLPGLWQLAFCLGVFASCRFLPRPMFVVGLWYMVSGLVCLVAGGAHHELTPWSMGIPFGVGQLLIAVVLKYGSEDELEETHA
jgi:hypothetical protein